MSKDDPSYQTECKLDKIMKKDCVFYININKKLIKERRI